MKSKITQILESRINLDTPIEEVIEIIKEVLEPLRGEEEYFVFESIVLPQGDTQIYYFSLSLDTIFEGQDIQYRVDLKYEATPMMYVLHNLLWSDRIDNFWETIKETNAFKYLQSDSVKPFAVDILDWYI